MIKYILIISGVFCLIIFTQCHKKIKSTNYTVNIDLYDKGKIFEGIGALSAGASTRLLVDYPIEQQNAILDYLFKPFFGASLQHLKVEIGGDVNSTSGTEPSHARTRQELLNPNPEFYNRGYEWWLMKEAKKRNQSIFLDCLCWGAPGWIGDGKFYSNDNIDYIISFIKGAKKYHDLTIDYTGIWNERMHNIEFVKELKKALLKNNLEHVKLVGSDQCCGSQWTIANEMLTDPDLMDAVDIIGDHYIETNFGYKSTPAAKSTGKQLWNSEGGPWKGNWDGFAALSKLYNRDYIVGGITKTITWSLITSYYENLALPNSGLMKADSPWSGYYEVEPALWAVAHTTQFAQPGWHYINGSGCGFLQDSTISYVTLVSPNSINDFSIIIESIDLECTANVSFKLPEELNAKSMSVWRSIKNKESFIKQQNLIIENNIVTLCVESGAVYSLTTTSGQQKGMVSIPDSTAFPFPYSEDFETVECGKNAPYICDQGGAFEVANRLDNKGHALRQIITRPCIEWEGDVINQTVVGDQYWTDYTTSVDVYFIDPYSHASLSGRVTETYRSHKDPDAYTLILESSGLWSLKVADKILAKGFINLSNDWHNLKLEMKGDIIKAHINHKEVAAVSDSTFSRGMISIGSSFNFIDFDNIKVY